MIIAFFRTSSRFLVFGLGLLLGIQVPAFVDQYRLRVDAHYREVSANIAGFQHTADAMFGGDLDALVSYYRESSDRVFQSDAVSLQAIVDRYQRFRTEQQIMQGSLTEAAWHVLVAADAELLDETRAQYTYTVPLDALALQWGAAIAMLVLLLSEACVFGCVKCAHLAGRRKRSRHELL
jgi:hypothetical protein